MRIFIEVEERSFSTQIEDGAKDVSGILIIIILSFSEVKDILSMNSNRFSPGTTIICYTCGGTSFNSSSIRCAAGTACSHNSSKVEIRYAA